MHAAEGFNGIIAVLGLCVFNYFDYWQHFTALAVLDVILVACVVPWVIMTRKEPAAAVAWCMVVVLMPIVGAGLFWLFGYSRIVRPLRRMRLHHQRFPRG